jgi:hypothetical protein
MPRSARAPLELRAAAELELRRRKAAAEAQIAAMGYDRPGTIPEHMSFREWCNELAAGGLLIDEKPFTLEDRSSMWFIYDLIPTTLEEARGKTVVMMKCAQVGFTVAEMLAAIYMALKFPPVRIGMYLPDRALAAAKSSERFLPIVRTIPQAYEKLTTDQATGKRRAGGEGNVMIRAMGRSRFHFLWTSGKSTTESFPMDVISFDEVQEMALKDMEKTRERLSASRVKFTLMGSTANWPDADIHWWYKKGTRHQFHTNCRQCSRRQVMDEVFPACVGYDERRKDYRYRCVAEDCGAWIDDPQDGEWIAQDRELEARLAEDPAAGIWSVHYPQFLSPTISPRELYSAYLEADDMQNFFNRKLGKPYSDPSQIPVQQHHLDACVAAGQAAGVQWGDRGDGELAMGIDQMGNFNVALIKRRLPDGRHALVHLEYVYGSDPFGRCSDLIKEFGVSTCVVEINPNYNDAKRFAQKHNFPVDEDGREIDRACKVFLANYGDIADEMIRWGDAKPNGQERKLAKDERDHFTVQLDQYKNMQVSLSRITKSQMLFPDPTGLVQEFKEKGKLKPVAVLKEVGFLHFMRTALVAEKDPEQKKYKRKVVKVGIDPHTSYALMLCDVAIARNHGTGTMILPPEPTEARQIAPGAAAAPGGGGIVAKGLPADVTAMMEDLPDSVCGRCSSFDPKTGACSARGFNVQRTDPSCPIFSSRKAA